MLPCRISLSYDQLGEILQTHLRDNVLSGLEGSIYVSRITMDNAPNSCHLDLVDTDLDDLMIDIDISTYSKPTTSRK